MLSLYMLLKIKYSQIPINPFQTFLGIKSDTKQHLMHLCEKILSRLIRYELYKKYLRAMVRKHKVDIRLCQQ